MIRALLAAAMCLAALPAWAQTILRDAEIERGLRELARPVLAAAGLPQSTRVIVVDDDRMNAFVADSRTIFVHSGLLLRLDDAAMLQAVLAHEAAHIANGHLGRRNQAARGASNIARVGLILGAALAATGNGRVGAGLAVGSGSAAERSFFAHTRAEESSADQSSLRYMRAAGIDPAAARRVLDLFRGQEALSVGRQDPYAQTHPLTRDRIRAVDGFVAAHPYAGGDTSRADYWFARAQGKLSAFLRAPSWTLRRVRGQRDTISVMRAAIAEHRRPRARDAIRRIDALLGASPNDPYWHELKGQILLESGNPTAAVGSYRRAASLAPREPLIQSGLGRALLASGQTREALAVLERVRGRDPFDPGLLRDLAQAYAQTGQPAMASVATAERFALLGRSSDARLHAERAAAQLPRGSAGWLRAQDLL